MNFIIKRKENDDTQLIVVHYYNFSIICVDQTHTDIQTHRHRDTQTHRPQTQRHTETQTRDTDTHSLQTHKHPDTQTQRRPDIQTH